MSSERAAVATGQKVTKSAQARALSQIVRRDPPAVRMTSGMRSAAVTMARSKNSSAFRRGQTSGR